MKRLRGSFVLMTFAALLIAAAAVGGARIARSAEHLAASAARPNPLLQLPRDDFLYVFMWVVATTNETGRPGWLDCGYHFQPASVSSSGKHLPSTENRRYCTEVLPSKVLQVIRQLGYQVELHDVTSAELFETFDSEFEKSLGLTPTKEQADAFGQKMGEFVKRRRALMQARRGTGGSARGGEPHASARRGNPLLQLPGDDLLFLFGLVGSTADQPDFTSWLNCRKYYHPNYRRNDSLSELECLETFPRKIAWRIRLLGYAAEYRDVANYEIFEALAVLLARYAPFGGAEPDKVLQSKIIEFIERRRLTEEVLKLRQSRK